MWRAVEPRATVRMRPRLACNSGAEGGFLYYVLPFVRGESLPESP
jgi:hypothetical protein